MGPNLFSRLIFAVAIAVVVGLACLLLGAILVSLGVPVARTVGEFLERWAWVIGVLAGLLSFASGRTSL